MVELRRAPDGEPGARTANGVIDILLGNQGGRILLVGYDGVVKNIAGGATLSTGNYPLYVRPTTTLGKHAQFRKSDDSGDVLAIEDAGVTIAALTLSGALSVGGTLTVTGTATFNGNVVTNAAVTLNSNVDVAGTLDVAGVVTLDSNATVGGTLAVTGQLTADGDFAHNGAFAGFFTQPPTTQPSLNGSRGGIAAVASIASALHTLGLADDNTTA